MQNNIEFSNAMPNHTAARAQAAALARHFASDPRIFGWSTLDEPSGAPDWPLDLYHAMKAEDGERPVLLNIGSDGWPALNVTAPIVKAADIATIDPYVDYRKDPADDWQEQDPYNSNSVRVVAKALDFLHTAIDATSSGNKPGQVMAVLGTLPRVPEPSAFRPATAAEARAEAFVAVRCTAQATGSPPTRPTNRSVPNTLPTRFITPWEWTT